MPGMPATIKPTLVGISSHERRRSRCSTASSSSETPQHLEMVLPSRVRPRDAAPRQPPADHRAVVRGLLAQQPVDPAGHDEPGRLPRAVRDARREHVDAPARAQHDPFAAQRRRDARRRRSRRAAAERRHARASSASTRRRPRASAARCSPSTDGAAAGVTFDVDRYDSRGRELEWTWNINGGMWRPYSSASPLVISDRAFAWQGKYEIGLKSRVKGDYRTVVGDDRRTPVVIDSVGPKHLRRQGRVGRRPAHGAGVGHRRRQGRRGRVRQASGDDEPRDALDAARATRRSRATAASSSPTSRRRGRGVRARRERQRRRSRSSRRSTARRARRAALRHGGAPGAGGLAAVRPRRLGSCSAPPPRRRDSACARAHRAATVGASASASTLASSLVPGCSCGKQPASRARPRQRLRPTAARRASCRSASTTRACARTTSRPAASARTRDVAVGADGSIWVSAYAQSHGDLVVAQATRRPHPRRGVGVGRRRARRPGDRARLEDPRRHRGRRSRRRHVHEHRRSRPTARRW